MLESKTNVCIGGNKEEAVEEEPWVEIVEKKDVTGPMPNGLKWGLPYCWLDKIDEWDTDFLAIRDVGNHIEIGPAQVNFIR